MGVTKLSDPGGIGWTGFIAAGNPILYKFQRKDFVLVNITDYTDVVGTITGNVLSSFTIGQTLTFVSDSGVIRSGILTAAIFGSGYTQLTLAGIGLGTGVLGSGYVNNLSLPLYRLSIRIFDANTNIDQFGFDFDYYSSKTGLIKVDITNAIQALISPEISFTPVTINQWFEDSSRKDFYIKYTEKWTGSANAQIDDSASPKKAIFATNQIGQSSNKIARGNFFGNPYSIFKESINVLTFDKFYGTTNMYLKITALGVSYYLPLDTVYSKIKSVFWRAFENIFVGQTSNILQAWTPVTASSWTSFVSIGQQSEWAAIILGSSNAPFDLYFDLTGDLEVASNCVLSIRCYDSSSTLITTYTVAVALTGGATNNTTKGKQTINVGGTIGHLEFSIGSVTVSSNNFVLKTRTDLKGTAQLEVRADIGIVPLTTKVNVNYAGGSPTLSLPPSEIIEPMDNKFNLVWRNKFGGLSNFVFPFSQEYYFTYSKNKAIQYLLYAESVKIDQLNLLHDLNTNGEVYSPVYDELSLSANATAKRIGAQVYKLDEDGRLTGVLVIPSAPKFRTSALRNKFQVTVEMPEVYKLPAAFIGTTGGGIFDSTFDDTFQ